MNENTRANENIKPQRNWALRRRDIAGMLLMIVVATVVFKRFSAMRDVARETTCSANLQQISSGLMQYIREYDEKLPLLGKWSQVVTPYLGSRQNPASSAIFQCPSFASPFGYAMRDKTIGLSISIFPTPSNTVWIFDADVDKSNAEGGKELLPKAARHPKGHAIVFVDGRIKVLKTVDFSKGFRTPIEIAQWMQQQKELREAWDFRHKLQIAADLELRNNKSLMPEKRRYNKARMLEKQMQKIAEIQRKQ